MVYKRSEYGHQFKVSSLVKNLPVYKEHLNYRHLRRERECAHTPLSWDGETIDSSESDEKLNPDEEIEKLPISELVINEEEEGDIEIEKDGMKEEQAEDLEDDIDREKRIAQAEDGSKQVKETEDDVVVVKQSEALRKSAKEKLNKYVSNVNKDQSSTSKPAGEKKALGKTFLKPKQADHKVFVKRSKPLRPDRQGKVPRARPQSAPSARPLAQGVETKKPFYNYGAGTDNTCTGNKKTFNVRASSAVYPAALRAKKRNLLLIEKQLERQKTASAREKRRKAKFNERMIRETAHWETEYHRCYPAYDNTEYATSERDPRKRKSFFLT
ncbi:centriole, cilia and spindle-associated protein-like [Mercenaria mercenaria]|uniref:centriole, cilia and spindle-associated protein-like n=1 Tax=Mercenaria mercenaria TaxID=6596 RepID=UPI00234F9AB7|nr:centriole, cilia and spindle-associated protein-like [Mercenaria mercenaria]XP_045182006.2 centriole, cilia and spindle-associated protein-like [Mercenaria mercenaria]